MRQNGMSEYAKTAAAAIRVELKAAFPGVKFKVVSSGSSMGNDVNVSWVDGPLTEKVEAIIMKYQYESYNGMEDLYENTNTRKDIRVCARRERSLENTRRLVELWNANRVESMQIELNICELDFNVAWKVQGATLPVVRRCLDALERAE
jgi:hypothetical protein